MPDARPSILIIDDEPDMRATLRAMLEPAGFDVTVASNFGQAVENINIAAPALIVTDIYMPGGDGFEFIAAMKRYRIKAPIIAMSGGDRTGQHDPLEIAERLGAVAVIAKPFTKRDLVELIERVIGETVRPEIDHDGNSTDA